MSTLQENLDAILVDKKANLLPENLKTGITCLGIKGTYTPPLTEDEYTRCLQLTGVILNGDTEYTPLSYLITSGTQYLDTLIPVTSTTEIEFEYYPLTADWGQWYLQAGDSYFVGTRDKNVSTLWWGYNGSNNSGISLSLITPLTTVKITNDGQILYNGEVKASGRGTSPEISETIKLAYGTSMRLGKVKIYQDGMLIRSFIPAKNNSTNEICVYEEILGEFYNNAGTGTYDYVE